MDICVHLTETKHQVDEQGTLSGMIKRPCWEITLNSQFEAFMSRSLHIRLVEVSQFCFSAPHYDYLVYLFGKVSFNNLNKP